MGSSASSAPAAGPTQLEDKYYPEWIKSPENIKDLTGKVALITGAPWILKFILRLKGCFQK